MLILGSFVATVAVAVFTWGSRTSLAMVSFAFLTHVLSLADAIRQRAFPGYGPRLPICVASAGLALGLYGPLVLLASAVAWPGPAGNQFKYLVNRWAYRWSIPQPGDRVWLAGSDGELGKVGQVLARPEEEVEWGARGLRLGGRKSRLAPFRSGAIPSALSYKVPPGRLLVAYTADSPERGESWELVPLGRVEGRAWARFSPVWNRRLLN